MVVPFVSRREVKKIAFGNFPKARLRGDSMSPLKDLLSHKGIPPCESPKNLSFMKFGLCAVGGGISPPVQIPTDIGVRVEISLGTNQKARIKVFGRLFSKSRVRCKAPYCFFVVFRDVGADSISDRNDKIKLHTQKRGLFRPLFHYIRIRLRVPSL